MKQRSRLIRRKERESKRNFVLSIGGIFIALILLIKYGIPLLANFSLLISGQNKGNLPQIVNTFLAQPSIDPLPTATNSAKIAISGKGEDSSTISLYINDSVRDKVDTDPGGSFKFQVTLTKGDNKIYVKAKKNSGTSLPSDTFTIFFKDNNPSLNITSPTDGQSFSKDQSDVLISGSTDAQTKVTVNDYWAVLDQSNNFSYRMKLSSGDNTVKIVAEDIAGNKTEKDIIVKYSP